MKRFYREYVSEERVYRVLGDRCGLISPPLVRSFPLNFNYPYSNHFPSELARTSACVSGSTDTSFETGTCFIRTAIFMVSS